MTCSTPKRMAAVVAPLPAHDRIRWGAGAERSGLLGTSRHKAQGLLQAERTHGRSGERGVNAAKRCASALPGPS